jgi:hypothetical protein
MGGVYNLVNMQVYHYAGNNPVKYIDPDGREMDDLVYRPWNQQTAIHDGVWQPGRDEDTGLGNLLSNSGITVTLFSRAVSDKTTSQVYNVLGKLWALPWTIVGFTIGSILWMTGKLLGKGSYAKFENNALTFTTGFKFVLLPIFSGSITLGNIIIHAGGDVENWNSKSRTSRYDNTNIDVNLGRHEQEHTYQYERYGIFMPFIWLFSAIIHGGKGKTAFEKAADDASELPGQR